MKEPATAYWKLPISTSDTEKLKTGYQLIDMDGECSIFSTVEGSITSIHVVRDLLDREVWILHIVDRTDAEGRMLVIDSITWTMNNGGYPISEMQAKKELE